MKRAGVLPEVTTTTAPETYTQQVARERREDRQSVKRCDQCSGRGFWSPTCRHHAAEHIARCNEDGTFNRNGGFVFVRCSDCGKEMVRDSD